MPITSSPLKNLRVLVVEDDPYLIALMDEFLKLEGARVTIAIDQQMAQVLLEQFQFDIIFCDFQLRDEDGYGLTSWLRQREIELKINLTPVIAVVDSERNIHESRIQSAGFQAYLSKPYNFEILLATVASVLEKNPN